MKDFNKTTGSDITYAAIKAGLGSIPILGSVATELFGLIVTPPLDKRRQVWMNEVAEKLKDLEENGKIDFLSLSQNEQFIDTVITATTYAIKTSEIEKITALRNTIINTSLNEAPEKTKSQIFLKLVDDFTVWHLKILSLFDNPSKWFQVHNKKFPNYISASLSTVIEEAFPEIKKEGELLNLIWADLKSAGLHNTSELQTTMTSNNLLAQRTTQFAKEFLRFISEN